MRRGVDGRGTLPRGLDFLQFRGENPSIFLVKASLTYIGVKKTRSAIFYYFLNQSKGYQRTHVAMVHEDKTCFFEVKERMSMLNSRNSQLNW